MLADATCPTCTMWEDGDPACPRHGGTYQEGLVCPTTGDEAHMVVVCQRGAAYVCMTCDELEELSAFIDAHGGRLGPFRGWRAPDAEPTIEDGPPRDGGGRGSSGNGATDAGG